MQLLRGSLSCRVVRGVNRTPRSADGKQSQAPKRRDVDRMLLAPWTQQTAAGLLKPFRLGAGVPSIVGLVDPSSVTTQALQAELDHTPERDQRDWTFDHSGDASESAAFCGCVHCIVCCNQDDSGGMAAALQLTSK